MKLDFWGRFVSFPEWLIILNSKAHLIWPKSAQKGAQYFFPKKSHIFGKRRTIFDPPNNFYCIFIHEFFGDAKFKKKRSKIFYFFWVFFYTFPFKGLFYHFTKAHKNFSRSHLTLKVAPMCSKAHTINHSVSRLQPICLFSNVEKVQMHRVIIFKAYDSQI